MTNPPFPSVPAAPHSHTICLSHCQAYDQDGKYQKDQQRLKGFTKLAEKLRFSSEAIGEWRLEGEWMEI